MAAVFLLTDKAMSGLSQESQCVTHPKKRDDWLLLPAGIYEVRDAGVRICFYWKRDMKRRETNKHS
jgi:hypothetical protein